MRYIEKVEPYQRFLEYVENNIDKNLSKEELKKLFKKMPSNLKTSLKEYILKHEQNYLCIYCEEKIEKIEHSHLEHIKHQDEYSHLIFDYNNLVVSCNGDGKCNPKNAGKNRKTTCGHKKNDKELPLNPLKDINISDYFEFVEENEKMSILIKPSDLDKEKAQDMIEILNLNSDSPNFNLPYNRWKEKEFIEKIIVELIEQRKNLKKTEDEIFIEVKNIIKNFLSSNIVPFITCIKFFLNRKGII